MNVYGLKACDTCRKAVKALTAAGHDARLVDVRDTPLDPGRLSRFHGAFGDRLVNTRSTTWRELPETERAGEPLDLIARHPALMKRPVIEHGDALYLGWDAGVRSALL